MAEKEETPFPKPRIYNPNQSRNYRHSQHQVPINDPNRPNIRKAQHLFGVKDLRQLLDQKHKDQQSKRAPPRDPVFNLLKDPLRDIVENLTVTVQPDQYYRVTLPTDGNHGAGNSNLGLTTGPQRSDKQHDETSSRDQQNPGQSFTRGRGRGRGKTRGLYRPPRSHSTHFLEHPVNIKVEVSNSGEHKYTIDETTNMQAIRHVPDIHNNHSRAPRRHGFGRGHYKAPLNARFQGRGGNRLDTGAQQPTVPHTQEDNNEENWDNDIIEPVVAHSENKELAENLKELTLENVEAKEEKESQLATEQEEKKLTEVVEIKELTESLNTSKNGKSEDVGSQEQNINKSLSDTEELKEKPNELTLENVKSEETDKKENDVGDVKPPQS